MLPLPADGFGNPSSDHAFGAAPKAALYEARTQVAGLINAEPAGIVFTGSGSEADQLAIRGTVLASGSQQSHVITQVTEHPAVLETCRALERLHNTRVTYLPVDGDGLVDPAVLASAMTPDTVLVSVMAANNETGALQPIAELASGARLRSKPHNRTGCRRCTRRHARSRATKSSGPVTFTGSSACSGRYTPRVALELHLTEPVPHGPRDRRVGVHHHTSTVDVMAADPMPTAETMTRPTRIIR